MKLQVDTVSNRAKQQMNNMGAWTKTQLNRAGDALKWASTSTTGDS